MSPIRIKQITLLPVITKILNQIKNIKLDRGTKNFQPSNLEVVKINIENTC